MKRDWPATKSAKGARSAPTTPFRLYARGSEQTRLFATMLRAVPKSGNHRRGAEDAEAKIRRVVLTYVDISAYSAPLR